jgi:hypothetical protein
MGRMLRWLVCGLLVLNLYGIGVGLWSSLFGPEAQEGLFAVVSFLVGIIVFALVGHWFMWRQSSGESLGLVQNPRMAEALRKWFWRSFQVVFVTAGVTCAVMFTAGSAGVANDTPILAPQHVYVLQSHGTKTEVSRARYVLVGTSFLVGWHVMATTPTLCALAFLLTGTSPFPTNKQQPKRLDNRAHNLANSAAPAGRENQPQAAKQA